MKLNLPVDDCKLHSIYAAINCCQERLLAVKFNIVQGNGENPPRVIGIFAWLYDAVLVKMHHRMRPSIAERTKYSGSPEGL